MKISAFREEVFNKLERQVQEWRPYIRACRRLRAEEEGKRQQQNEEGGGQRQEVSNIKSHASFTYLSICYLTTYSPSVRQDGHFDDDFQPLPPFLFLFARCTLMPDSSSRTRWWRWWCWGRRGRCSSSSGSSSSRRRRKRKRR